METKLTIQNMGVDSNAKLQADVRKNLSEIIESEFKSRVQVDFVKKNEAKKTIVQNHKRKLGVDKILASIKKKEQEIQQLKVDLDRNGFNTRGEYCANNSDIEEELTQLNQTSQEILTVKHKLITRLQLSTTVGEATVIMHDILGNTLIPELSQNAITFQGK